MKKVFLSLLLMPVLAFSQLGTGYIGLNTSTPNATLDIKGVPNDITKFDGVIAPRITGQQLVAKNYGVLQTGAIVYVTAIPTTLAGQVINISEVGYYYFDGNIWKSFEDDTLEDVVRRGNHSPKFITFTGGNTGEAERDGALGMKLSTYSYFFGNMNPDHTGLFNASFGYNALANLTTAYYNTAVGSQAGSKTTTGNSNSYFGDEAGYNNTTGYKNAIFGMGAAYHNSTGSFNSIFGFKAGQFRSLGNYNVLIGNNTGSAASPTVTALGNNNVFIGTGAGFGDGNISNKLIIHSNNSLTSTNSIEGVFSNPAQSQLANALVTGDFVDRWFRINGKFEINPSRISASTAAHTKILAYNPTTGDVAANNLGDFLTRAGTGVNNPLYGDLEYIGGGNGFYSQSNTRINGFTITEDDVMPSAVIYNTAKDGTSSTKITLESGGIFLKGELIGDGDFLSPTSSNSLVQKMWVENLVNSTIKVPTPPANGSYILTSINGVMQWVAN